MTEEEMRETLAQIDRLRERAKIMDRIADWPMGVPSEMVADKKRGWFASIWRGSGETVMGQVTLTREERHELVAWMREHSTALKRQAQAMSFDALRKLEQEAGIEG